MDSTYWWKDVILLSDTYVATYLVMTQEEVTIWIVGSWYLDRGIKKPGTYSKMPHSKLKRYQITTTFFILGFEDAGAAAIHYQNAFDTKHFLLFSFLFVYLFFKWFA